jgi:hypothetical protein
MNTMRLTNEILEWIILNQNLKREWKTSMECHTPCIRATKFYRWMNFLFIRSFTIIHMFFFYNQTSTWLCQVRTWCHMETAKVFQSFCNKFKGLQLKQHIFSWMNMNTFVLKGELAFISMPIFNVCLIWIIFFK